jgi:hypothetical protein
MIAALLLVAGSANAAAVEASDTGLAYTRCLFASSRAAAPGRLSLSAFQRSLAGACLSEQRALERDSMRLFSLRGEPDPSGQARGLSEDARRQVVETYRQMLELAPQFERMREICRADPSQCQ